MKALMQYMGSLETRPVNSADHAFLRRLYASTRTDLTEIAAAPQFVAALVDMQERMQTIGFRQNHPGASYLVLENLGVAVGRIVVDTGPAEIRLIDLALLPHARGQGFGTAVLLALQRKAMEQALPLVATVHRNNALARQLYMALGFLPGRADTSGEHMVWRHDARPAWEKTKPDSVYRAGMAP